MASNGETFASPRSDCQGRIDARRSTSGLHSHDFAELTTRSGTVAPRSRAKLPTIEPRASASFHGRVKLPSAYSPGAGR